LFSFSFPLYSTLLPPSLYSPSLLYSSVTLVLLYFILTLLPPSLPSLPLFVSITLLYLYPPFSFNPSLYTISLSILYSLLYYISLPTPFLYSILYNPICLVCLEPCPNSILFLALLPLYATRHIPECLYLCLQPYICSASLFLSPSPTLYTPSLPFPYSLYSLSLQPYPCFYFFIPALLSFPTLLLYPLSPTLSILITSPLLFASTFLVPYSLHLPFFFLYSLFSFSFLFPLLPPQSLAQIMPLNPEILSLLPSPLS
jgi:hypothetical protein